MQHLRIHAAATLLAVSFVTAAELRAAERVQIARDGNPLQAVAVSETASKRVRKAARTLCDHLSRISGVKFEPATGDGTAGITVGLAGDFPQLSWAKKLAEPKPADRERYVLRSHV